MDIRDSNIIELINSYISLLSGQNIKDAIIVHAKNAGIKMTYINFDKSDKVIVSSIFESAKGQGKLNELIDVIQTDGFDIIKNGKLIDLNQEVGSVELYRKWLENRTKHIDIRGIGERKPDETLFFPVLKLYTELYVKSDITNGEGKNLVDKGNKRVSLNDMVDATNRLLIVGDPGSGKTTFLQYITWKVITKNPELLPIYNNLSDIFKFAKDEKIQLDTNIFAYYCIDLSKKENLDLSEDIIFNSMNNGKCLFLLDGLDELPSTNAIEKMVSIIEGISRRWEKCKIVITSRPIPLKGKAIPAGFEITQIGSWQREDVEKYLSSWISLVYKNETEETRQSHWRRLLSTIISRQDLLRLSSNAVMLTAMVVIDYNEKKLPDGRVALLASVVRWLIEARAKPMEQTTYGFKFTENIYCELALAMFEAKGGRRRRVGKSWAATQLTKYFKNDRQKALNFIINEETERGLLVPRGKGDFEFWHLSFQEYLSAKAIASKTDDIDTGWWSRIKDKLDLPEWQEVLTSIPICLFQLGSERVDLFFQRLGQSCQDSSNIMKVRRLALGAKILRDLPSTEYQRNYILGWNELMSEVYPLLFDSITSDVHLETKYEAAIAYGLWGDERFYDSNTLWVELPGGEFLYGAQPENDKKPNYDKNAAPWEKPVIKVIIKSFEMRKFLITVNEYKLFIEEGGYNNCSEILWCSEGWEWKKENDIKTPLDWENQVLEPNTPITGISWFEANAYCRWLTNRCSQKMSYRLPTEVEWEYAAKRGIICGINLCQGDKMTAGDNAEANWAGSYLRKKSPVGMFPLSNTTDGISDLFGNVEEWCFDKWTTEIDNNTNKNIDFLSRERYRIVRGGSCIRFSRLCRPTYRSRIWRESRYHTVGFRPVRINKN